MVPTFSHTQILLKSSFFLPHLAPFHQVPMANLNTIFTSSMILYTLFLHLFLFPSTISSISSIHDLLKSKGLPAGLFPKNFVKSYNLDKNGHLEVYLERPCVAKFETWVFFDTIVKANLSYGGLIGLEGLSQEELFLWLPVKDIIVYDPSSGLILFDIGLAHKQISLSLFEEPPLCTPQGLLLENDEIKESGFRIDSRFSSL